MVLARLLIKCYGKEFYKINAGFLITAFTVIIGYGLFIKTAGHIPEGQALTINFILLLQFLEAPVMTLMVCFLWLIYSIKCWRYVWKMSLREDQVFWRYSATSISLSKQFANWLFFQWYLFLPLAFYWVIATVYGLFTQHYQASLFSGAYLTGLTLLSAALYLYRFNFYPFGKQGTSQLFTMRNCPKPVFSLFLFEILSNTKLNLLLTKSISLLLIIGFYQLFDDVDQIARTAGIIALCLTLSHGLMAYQDDLFTKTHLYFMLQFPYQRLLIYFYRICTYMLLLLPELLWYLFSFYFPIALLLIGLSISSILFIRAIPEIIGLNMRIFLKWIFGYFFVSMILLLYNLGWYVVAINALSAISIFYHTYYRKETVVIK